VRQTVVRRQAQAFAVAFSPDGTRVWLANGTRVRGMMVA
jgi:hypothetical protein